MKRLLFTALLPLFFYTCAEDSTYNAPIPCENNGISNGKGCDCPPDFTGIYCEFFKRPNAIYIDTITFTAFPEYNGSQLWDPDDNSGADIYIYIGNRSTIVIGHEHYDYDADPNQLYIYIPEEPLKVTSYSDMFFSLVDFDGPTNPGEYVDRYVEDLWDRTKGYPTKFERTMDSGTNFALSLRYDR